MISVEHHSTTIQDAITWSKLSTVRSESTMQLIDLHSHQTVETVHSHHHLPQIHEWLIRITHLRRSSIRSLLQACLIHVDRHHNCHLLREFHSTATAMGTTAAVTADKISTDSSHTTRLNREADKISINLRAEDDRTNIHQIEVDTRMMEGNTIKEDTTKVEDRDRGRMDMAEDRPREPVRY